MMDYKRLFARGFYGGRWNIEFGTKPTDKFLDLGGGDNPHPKSTDIIDKSTPEAEFQRCGRKLRLGNRTYWDGYAEEILPTIPNKYFDFMYTASVLEHTDDLPLVLREINRTCKRGFVLIPDHYMDLWNAGLDTHHQWFFAYDYKRNVLKYRRRLPHEYIQELVTIKPPFLNWDNNIISSHYNNFNVRGLWELRFYWEDQIDFEEDLEIYGESKYRLDKFCFNEDLRYEEIDICDVCRTAEKKPILAGSALEISLCKNCGTAFASRRFSKHEIEKRYANYLPSSFVENNKEKKVERIKDAEFQLDLIQKYIIPGGKLLDVGAAAGTFLSVARDRGWEVYGTELSNACIETAKLEYNINLYFGESTSFIQNHLDVIVLWNALEHLYYPRQELEHLTSLLNPGGLVLIKIPNHTEQTLTKWPMLPEHVYNYTTNSISFLLKELGYNILEKIDGYDDEIPTLTILAQKAI